MHARSSVQGSVHDAAFRDWLLAAASRAVATTIRVIAETTRTLSACAIFTARGRSYRCVTNQKPHDAKEPQLLPCFSPYAVSAASLRELLDSPAAPMRT